MIKKVAFFCKHFGERGTERTTFDYADFNEKILGNISYIICFNESVIKDKKYISSKDFVKKKYFNRFEVFEINSIHEIKDILLTKKINYFYVQSHGFYRDIFKFNNFRIWGNCQTIYHCAFGPMVRQGSSIRCIVGGFLNKRFSKNLPVLPPIVRPFEFHGDFKSDLNIPAEAIVIGRHGGKETFDINFVKEVIKNFLKSDDNIYFLFLNTKKFLTHKNVFYFENLNDNEVSKFIGTCDAMIHGRSDGETFGLAVAEFSVANKPVITYSESKDREHLGILKGKAILYKNKQDLIEIFNSIGTILKKRKSWNAYKDFEPEKIMNIFDKVCLSKRKLSFKRQAATFIQDLPWEIKVSLQIIPKSIIIFVIKKLPKDLKNKINSLFK